MVGDEGTVECRDVADLQSASCRSSLIEGAEGRVECSDVADLQPVLGANASMLAHASKIDIKRRIILAFRLVEFGQILRQGLQSFSRTLIKII